MLDVHGDLVTKDEPSFYVSVNGETGVEAKGRLEIKSPLSTNQITFSQKIGQYEIDNFQTVTTISKTVLTNIKVAVAQNSAHPKTMNP